MTKTTETTTRKTDLTNGRGVEAVTADLREQIAEARAAVESIDMAAVECDIDLLDELDGMGVRFANDMQPEGIMWQQAPGWEASDTAVTIDLAGRFEAWATVTAYEVVEDGHAWTESTDGITVVEGVEGVAVGGW